ncbi:MAG: 50S ribosomal protein L4 [Patescibacteria group bacterium]|nr:50S ribosomal protein L4 [Patescibacteria group bacterium]MCL5224299.1 50S ribosomal protein L4 [Patescibacteria group bacterium]
MTVDLYDKANKKVGTLDLPEQIFGVKWNPDLVQQAVLAQQINARKPSAHAKGRGEVSGGGKKPYRQKGTGQARHGSIRSPLWRHGGVTHGPNAERASTVSLNKKMKKLALFTVLSQRLRDNEIKFVDSLEDVTPKTKAMAAVLETLLGKARVNALIVPTSNRKTYQIIRNIDGAKVLDPEALNVYDLLKYKQIVIEKGAIPLITKHYVTE